MTFWIAFGNSSHPYVEFAATDTVRAQNQRRSTPLGGALQYLAAVLLSTASFQPSKPPKKGSTTSQHRHET